VKVWNIQTGQEIVTFKGHTVPVVGVAFSPDSKRIISCSSKPLGISNSDPGEPGEVKVWDAESGQEIVTLQGHKRFVGSVAYSHDGKRLASLSRDNTLKIWDAQTGRELRSLPVQAADRGIVAFSPDGKRIASSNGARNTIGPAEAGEIKVWDVETGDELFVLQGHTGWVTDLAYSPDGKRLASGAGGLGGRFGGVGARELKIWDAESGDELLTFEKVGGGVVFSPDGCRLVNAGTEGLKIYDATPVRE
jgi:WD40 repeat protein